MGKGEDLTGGREKPSLLSDSYEAVLGAVYLDRGFKKASDLVAKHFKDIVEKVGAEGFAKDYKTRLQEEVQAQLFLSRQGVGVRGYGRIQGGGAHEPVKGGVIGY